MKRIFIITLLPVLFMSCLIAVFSNLSAAKTVVIAGLKATYNENAEPSAKWSLDLSPAFGTGTIIAADDIAVDALGNATVTISSTQNIYVGKYIASILPGEMKYNAESGSGTLDVNAHFYFNVAGNMIDASSLLAVSKKGISDTKILLSPPDSRKVLFSARTAVAYFGVNSGVIDIVNGKAGDAMFSVSLSVLESKLSVGSVNMVVFFAQDAGMAAHPLTDPDISGYAEGAITVGKMRLELPAGVRFVSGPETGLNISIPEAKLDISEIAGGMEPIGLSKPRFEKGAFIAESDIDKTLEINGIAYKLVRITVNSQKDSGGGIYLKATFDGFVSGRNASASTPGLIVMDSEGMLSIPKTK